MSPKRIFFIRIFIISWKMLLFFIKIKMIELMFLFTI